MEKGKRKLFFGSAKKREDDRVRHLPLHEKACHFLSFTFDRFFFFGRRCVKVGGVYVVCGIRVDFESISFEKKKKKENQ